MIALVYILSNKIRNHEYHNPRKNNLQTQRKTSSEKPALNEAAVGGQRSSARPAEPVWQQLVLKISETIFVCVRKLILVNYLCHIFKHNYHIFIAKLFVKLSPCPDSVVKFSSATWGSGFDLWPFLSFSSLPMPDWLLWWEAVFNHSADLCLSLKNPLL